MRQTILITGGAGFLGSHMARALVERGDRVVLYDSVSIFPQNLIPFQERVKLVHGDILDLSYLMRTIKAEEIKRIIHTAALVDFASTIEKPALTAKINIEGTINVLEASRILGIERLMDISSEEVYGQFPHEPLEEDYPVSPMIPYSITKVAAQRYEEFFHAFFGLDVVIIRTSWVYGWGLPRARPPRTFIENSLRGVPIEMETGGDHRVDHTYIDDFVQGALLAFDVNKPKHRIFNIASGKAHTFKEMAQMVRNIIPGAKITLGPGLLRYADGVGAPQKGALSIQRAQSELGYQPQYDLFEGLKKYADSLRQERI